MSATESDLRRASRYSRDSGAICFELPLLGPSGRAPRDLVEELLASDLEWLWTSETRPPSPNQRADVVSRALTHVTDLTVPALVADLSDRDQDGFGRFVALFGVRKVPERLESGWLHDELGRLAAEEDGDLQLVLVQIGDTPNDYVYVRRDPSGSVARMLEQWGVGEAGSLDEKKYRALRVATLENLFGLNAVAAP